MAVSLFQFDTIAATLRIMRPTINMVIAMSMAQSAPSAIDKAAGQHKWLFTGYILLLLFTAVMTWLVWRSGNKVQDAIQLEASARIEEAKEGAAHANEEAERANERAENLEKDNLTLQGQVAGLQKAASDALAEQQRVQTQLAEQQGRTAQLEKTASDARAAQQRVETELAKQQQRAANAEQALLELKQRIKPRLLTVDQATILIQSLSDMPEKGDIYFQYLYTDPEATDFALQLIKVFKTAGWRVSPVGMVGDMPVGLAFDLADAKHPPARHIAVAEAFRQIGYEIKGRTRKGSSQTDLVLAVGSRP